MPENEAIALLASSHFIHLASTDVDGTPVLRTLNAALVDGAVCFHGAPAGEKLGVIGRRAVISVEEVVAELPSYILEPERACGASVLYRSVQAHGTVERVDDVVQKARLLQALMEHCQPQGGHVPIQADHPLYQAMVREVLVLRVPLERVDGKAKLGQNRKPEEITRVLDQLWQLGRPGDARAIELVRGANPRAPAPDFLAAPAGITLRCALDERHADEAVELLAGSYWNAGTPRERIRRAQLGATAWVGALDERGRLVGSARALADGAKRAMILDVIVDPAWRGRGIGSAVLRLLLDHPAVRECRKVTLHTHDAQALYARFGFVEKASSPYPEMVL